MSNVAEMTDAQLSERVCRVLGIEPRRKWVVGCQRERTVRMSVTACEWSENGARAWLDMMQRQGLHLDQEVYPVEVYPNVLDWSGFGLVVARLRKVDVYVNVFVHPYTVEVALVPKTRKQVFGEHQNDLPRALALAVIQMEGR